MVLELKKGEIQEVQENWLKERQIEKEFLEIEFRRKHELGTGKGRS